MSEQEDFEKWLASPPYDLPESGFEKHDEYGMWPGQYRKYHVQLASESWEHQQAIIDKQAAELAALRKLLNEIVDRDLLYDNDLYDLGLIDANCNPTKLLTGGK